MKKLVRGGFRGRLRVHLGAVDQFETNDKKDTQYELQHYHTTRLKSPRIS